MICLVIWFLFCFVFDFYPACCSLSAGGLSPDTDLEKLSVIIVSNIFSISSPSGIIVCVLYLLCHPTVLGECLLCFLVPFLFAFQSRNFYCHILKFRDSFLSCVHSTNEPIKSIHFCYNIFDLWHLFLFEPLLRVSISLLTFSICSYTLSVFPIKALGILTIVLKNSWSDNSNILVIGESGFNACLVSSNCVFVF